MTLPVVFLYTCLGLLAKFVFGNYAIDKSSAASSLVTTVMEDFRPQVINNQSISGVTMACRHTLPYFVNSNIQYEMCVAQTDEYLKSGDSIIGIIRVRNFMPTCRSLQLLLWMHSQIHESNGHRNYAIDVGANIGKIFTEMTVRWITPTHSIRHLHDAHGQFRILCLRRRTCSRAYLDYPRLSENESYFSCSPLSRGSRGGRQNHLRKDIS
jgi:hypothetical protein